MVFLLAAVNDLADERSNGVVEVLDGKLNEEGAAIRDGLVNANGQSRAEMSCNSAAMVFTGA